MRMYQMYPLEYDRFMVKHLFFANWQLFSGSTLGPVIQDLYKYILMIGFSLFQYIYIL